MPSNLPELIYIEGSANSHENPAKNYSHGTNGSYQTAKYELCLQERVRVALSEEMGVPLVDVHCQQNKEKYYNPDNLSVAGPDLEEVLGLMTSLNQAAMDNRVGAAVDGAGCFRETLASSAKDIAARLEGREFYYVELGPEPTKTVFVIQELLRHGAHIRCYIGVDINPASKEVMAKALSEILGKERIRHVTASFDDFSIEDIRESNTPALVTTLGFQEGNEDPLSLPAFYRKLLGPGDLLLSEMQLLADLDSEDRDRAGSIESFYQIPLMRRFSRLAFERVYGSKIPSQGGFALARVGSFTREDLWAAILYETPQKSLANGNHNSSPPQTSMKVPRVFISNYCLKYSSNQFRKLRQNCLCSLNVLAENKTGDGSVVFQLSQRI